MTKLQKTPPSACFTHSRQTFTRRSTTAPGRPTQRTSPSSSSGPHQHTILISPPVGTHSTTQEESSSQELHPPQSRPSFKKARTDIEDFTDRYTPLCVIEISAEDVHISTHPQAAKGISTGLRHSSKPDYNDDEAREGSETRSKTDTITESTTWRA